MHFLMAFKGRNNNLAFSWHLKATITFLACMVKANHCPLLHSNLFSWELVVGGGTSKLRFKKGNGKLHHIILKVSSLPLVKLKRKIKASREERTLGFI